MSKDEPTINDLQQTRSAQELYINNETSQTVAHDGFEGDNVNPQYEMLKRNPAANSTPYDCLNRNRITVAENVYVNPILGATDIELNINQQSSQATAYNEIDVGNFKSQYEKLDKYPAVTSNQYDCLDQSRATGSENVYISPIPDSSEVELSIS